MNHYIAFLRGINLGKRRLKMDDLRILFEGLKFKGVETFIASGNVIFSTAGDATGLEDRIERHLHKSLGYEVDTFVRTREEIAFLATHLPFAAREMNDPKHTVHVAFLRRNPRAELAREIQSCRTAADEFSTRGDELFWLCRIKTNESKVWTSLPMKKLGLKTMTMRNLKTIRNLAEKYPAGEAVATAGPQSKSGRK